jgi:Protein of unknown function (DUF2971)
MDVAPTPIAENGQLLHHYTSRDAAFGHIVPSSALRLSPLATMRDPVENKDWAEQLLAPIAWPETDVEKLERLAADTLRTTKILSFTLDRPLSPGVSAAHAWGYARPRMWEQYAENHQGVCLVFDRSALHGQIIAQLKARNDAFAGEVTYSDAPLAGHTAARSLDATRILVEGDGEVERGLRAHLLQHVDELFFRKLEDWRTEEEFRYVLLDSDDADIFVPIVGLRAVVVGERFPDWQLASAAKACEGAGIALLKMSWRTLPELVEPLESASSG